MSNPQSAEPARVVESSLSIEDRTAIRRAVDEGVKSALFEGEYGLRHWLVGRIVLGVFLGMILFSVVSGIVAFFLIPLLFRSGEAGGPV